MWIFYKMEHWLKKKSLLSEQLKWLLASLLYPGIKKILDFYEKNWLKWKVILIPNYVLYKTKSQVAVLS